jgi:hypothetical protein
MPQRQLPIEVKHCILNYFKDWNIQFQNDSYAKQALYSLCLVSKEWNQVAMPFLWTDPYIQSPAEFLKMSLSSKEPKKWVKRLYLKRFEIYEISDIPLSIACFQNLRVLHIRVPKFTLPLLEDSIGKLPLLTGLFLDTISLSEDRPLNRLASTASKSTHANTIASWSEKDCPQFVNLLSRLTHLDLYLGIFLFF